VAGLDRATTGTIEVDGQEITSLGETNRIRSTASAHGVTATAGPWPEVVALYSIDSSRPGSMPKARTGSLSPASPNAFLTTPIAALRRGPVTVDRSRQDSDFILLNGVIAGLALILTVIAIAGVFNTVILSTREKVRDIAILKALGMAPAQVVSMVVVSVALLGLVAGVFGIPVGLLLHAQVLIFMAHAASGTNVPPAFFDLISHAVLPLLTLAGAAIAAVGAWMPAQWAASGRVSEVLQAE
jgi:putative ABC transport system permease protein